MSNVTKINGITPTLTQLFNIIPDYESGVVTDFCGVRTNVFYKFTNDENTQFPDASRLLNSVDLNDILWKN